jgi:hypothetical protein
VGLLSAARARSGAGRAKWALRVYARIFPSLSSALYLVVPALTHILPAMLNASVYSGTWTSVTRVFLLFLVLLLVAMVARRTWAVRAQANLHVVLSFTELRGAIKCDARAYRSRICGTREVEWRWRRAEWMEVRWRCRCVVRASAAGVAAAG